MPVTRELPEARRIRLSALKWKRRRDIPIAILAWTGVTAVILWGAMHVIRAILLLVVAGMLAYALTPIVAFLERFMKRPIAIILACLVTLILLCLLLYTAASTFAHQSASLSSHVRDFVNTGQHPQPTAFEQLLHSFGITQSQIIAIRQHLMDRLESLAGSAIPWIPRVLDFLLDMVVVAVMMIYFMIDGPRINVWCRKNLPASIRADFLLDTLERVIGGYIRGQLTLAIIIGLLVGGGMTVIGVPYSLLLGILAFILEFVPILGTLISGAVCTLVALTQGWLMAAIVLAYFIVVHVFEGDIVGPRIVGKAVGIHPIVSLAALIAGSELFGIWGALLASPIAGLIQALLVAFWAEWRVTHPDQFENVKTDAPAGECELTTPEPVEAIIRSEATKEGRTPRFPHGNTGPGSSKGQTTPEPAREGAK